MGWFSPIKGHYPSLGQLDKTLPVASGVTAIERGTIIEMTADSVNAAGAFKVAADATNEGLLYIALQDFDDAQAGMAGTTGFDLGTPSQTKTDYPANMVVTPGVPTITGLALAMDGEYETNVYVKEGAKSLVGAQAGAKLTVEAGHLALAGDNDVVVGYLTAPVSSRWINNLNVKPEGATKHTVTRQGGTASVIRFRTK